MRLRCINTDIITIETPMDIFVLTAEDLELDKEYITDNTHPYIDEDGIMVYDINGYGKSLADRFEVI